MVGCVIAVGCWFVGYVFWCFRLVLVIVWKFAVVAGCWLAVLVPCLCLVAVWVLGLCCLIFLFWFVEGLCLLCTGSCFLSVISWWFRVLCLFAAWQVCGCVAGFDLVVLGEAAVVL